VSVFTAGEATAQPATGEVDQPDDPTLSSVVGDEPAQQHDMQHMQMEHGEHMWMRPSRDSSGTSWLPDDTPMYELHGHARPRMLMAHGNVFLQYLYDSGNRGSDQAGSINWVMGMADRTVGAGHLGFRGMMSLEPWTIRGCGYPDLLASGEACEGEAIHDRQHPHDLFMELTATYGRPLAGNVRLPGDGGPVGGPALGAPAVPPRISAIAGPLAPHSRHR